MLISDVLKQVIHYFIVKFLIFFLCLLSARADSFHVKYVFEVFLAKELSCLVINVCQDHQCALGITQNHFLNESCKDKHI
jgi:ABC-type polysaccharide/polyol phosphate export permease